MIRELLRRIWGYVVDVVQKVEEVVEKFCIWINYYIENIVGGKLYYGTMKSNRLVISRSFIKACPSQIKHVNELIKITSDNRFLATVIDLVDALVTVLVAEQGLEPVTSYVQDTINFHSSNNATNNSNYWNHISYNFQLIFG